MIITAPVLTNAGKSLLARALAGETVTFTRFKIGSGKLGGRTIADMTDLVTVKKAFAITKFDTSEAGVLLIQGRFSSADITTAFVWRELGVFAKGEDDVELLYAYSNDGDDAQTLPAVSSDVAVTQIVTMAVAIGDAENVTAEFDPDPEYASSADLLELEAATVGTTWTEIALNTAGGVEATPSDYQSIGFWTGHGACYRVEDGHHVYVHLSVKFAWAGSTITLTGEALPDGIKPSSRVVGYGAVQGSQMLGRFYIDHNDGLVKLETINNLDTGSKAGNFTCNWTDVTLEYFLLDPEEV